MWIKLIEPGILKAKLRGPKDHTHKDLINHNFWNSFTEGLGTRM